VTRYLFRTAGDRVELVIVAQSRPSEPVSLLTETTDPPDTDEDEDEDPA
jgi:hypothetical protein